jgi:MoaA/NifB/PqqE/SkfB family radical SAM enzyme
VKWSRRSRVDDGPARDAQLNVYNVAQLRSDPPDRFYYVRFDPNNDCNVHCVYCHNHRSEDVVSAEDLDAFLRENVVSLENFQMGCIMEPTLDPRLGDLLLLVARSRAKPLRDFVLQTNGILLHMHDPTKLRDAGLTRLHVSIDSSDPKIHRALRGGTSLAKVGANVQRFIKSCAPAEVSFVTTVTRLNLPSMEALVRYGLDLGVRSFAFREVFYWLDSDVVDHARMPGLVLLPGQFAEMAARLRAGFPEGISFDFADDERLARLDQKMRLDSRR